MRRVVQTADTMPYVVVYASSINHQCLHNNVHHLVGRLAFGG